LAHLFVIILVILVTTFEAVDFDLSRIQGNELKRALVQIFTFAPMMILFFLFGLSIRKYSQHYPVPGVDEAMRQLLSLSIVRIGSIMILIAVLSLIVAPFGIGYLEAKKEKNFQTVYSDATGLDLVVLRIYGEYLITAPLDRTAKTVERKLHVLKLENISQIPLAFENVSPLKVAEPSQP
jgi:hypothetical protein